MTPQAALVELLERVGVSQGDPVLVSEQELSEWPSPAVAALKVQGLLTKARPVSSAVCPGCERGCVMPVHVVPDAARGPKAFIVCDKRSGINRVTVPVSCLEQWQSNPGAVRGFIVDSLALRGSDQRPGNANFLEIGIATGDKRSKMLCLTTDGTIALIAGTNALPLAELIRYRDDAYSLDEAMIRQLVDSATTADDRYTPSTARRETRKLDTQAMHESWQKEYRSLKKTRRNMSDVWYSQQIAKMEIAKGRDAETIRRNMKK